MTARFEDNEDGTVTDTKTGLVWAKKTIAKDVSYEEAEETLLALGGHLRIPTLEELLTLPDYTRWGPAIDTEIFPDTKNYAYWTSTPCAGNSAAQWVVHFGSGSSYNIYRSNYACVRAIRDDQ